MGVAAFGALAGGGAAQVVDGLRIETAVSVALLVAAVGVLVGLLLGRNR